MFCNIFANVLEQNILKHFFRILHVKYKTLKHFTTFLQMFYFARNHVFSVHAVSVW